MNAPYHHGDLKATLLTHALAQLERKGADALSMREMAKAIDVSHTAAYRHFADKRALLEALAVQGFDNLRLACEQAVAAAPPSPRQRLQACGLAYVRFGLDNPKLLTHMFGAVGQGEATELLVGAGAGLFAVLQTLVTQGQAQGQFRAGDVRELAYACWAMVHGLAMLLSLGRSQADSPAVDRLMDSAAQSMHIFLDGVDRLA